MLFSMFQNIEMFLVLIIQTIIVFQIVEYNIPARQYTMFSNSLQSCIPKQWLARPFPITNIIFDKHNENIIIMQDDSSVYVINKNSELPEKEAKIPKRENGESTEDSNSISSSHFQHAFQVAKKYKVMLPMKKIF